MIDILSTAIISPSPDQIHHFWEVFWVSFGFAAQLIFAARFVVQWIVSEKEGKSTIPLAFWYLSLTGGGMLLMYAIYRCDPVFIVGQATGFLIYLRNLYLIKKEKRTHSARQAN